MVSFVGLFVALVATTLSARAMSDGVDLNALLVGKSVPRGGPYSLPVVDGPIQFASDFPIQFLAMGDIKPMTDPLSGTGETICCPKGTAFDSQTRSCVFRAADLCEKGFTLDKDTKSLCIRDDPPCLGDLKLEDGHCVSPHLPTCGDAKAEYKTESRQCEAIVDPVCDPPLKPNGTDCVSETAPFCDVGFHPEGAQCLLIGGPKCGSPEDGLIPHKTTDKDNNPKLICISLTQPSCGPGAHPDNDQCIRDNGPACDLDYENKNGSCVYKKGTCEQGGKFTLFPDNRDPVCVIEEEARCEFGQLKNKQCISDSNPCGKDSEGWRLEDEETCRRTDDVQCLPGTEVILAPPDRPGQRGRDQPQRAFCCPSGVTGMEIDARDQCSFPSGREPCPAGMSPDPNDRSRCIYQPVQADCPTPGGIFTTLSNGTVVCEETKDADCSSGTPDPETGRCNLGKPNCKTFYGDDYTFDEEKNKCVSEKEPKCPPGSDRRLKDKGDCISENDSECPVDAPHSSDKTKCVYLQPPDCKGKGEYDPKSNRCVSESKPTCTTPDGVKDAVLKDLRCVSPSIPACDPNSGTNFDSHTNKCIGTKAPKCESEAFRLDFASGACVLKTGPSCDDLNKSSDLNPKGYKYVFDPESGKCVSTDPPVCPEGSKWMFTERACVSNTRPCKGGTPDSNGRCTTPEPPDCTPFPGTDFVAGIGCVSKNVDPNCPLPAGADPTIRMTIDAVSRQCVADRGPSCGNDPDLQVVGDQCVSQKIKPGCPTPTKSDGKGKCVLATQPECGDNKLGLSFDKDSGKCFAEPTCTGAATLDEERGKCVTTSERTCFAVLYCPDVVDEVPAIGG